MLECTFDLFCILHHAYRYYSDTSLTDPWARIISYHFLNQTNRNNFFSNNSAHGAGQLWSDIPDIPTFQQYLMPVPIAVSDSRPGGDNATTFLGLDATVSEVNDSISYILCSYFTEITPFELASYDPSLSAGTNLSFAGTPLTDGQPANGTACVNGFDQAGFVMGSSASLFNVSRFNICLYFLILLSKFSTLQTTLSKALQAA